MNSNAFSCLSSALNWAMNLTPCPKGPFVVRYRSRTRLIGPDIFLLVEADRFGVKGWSIYGVGKESGDVTLTKER